MIEESLKNEIIEKIKELSTEQKPHFAALYHQLMELYKAEEVLSVGNRKINKGREPIFEQYTAKVSALANGQEKATKELLGNLAPEEGFFTAEEISQLESTQPAKLDKYWYKVLNQIEPIQSFIVPEDEEALAALNSVHVQLNEETDNYNVVFHFAENKFFSNNKLELKFTVNSDDECTKIESDKIEWKEGECLTEKIEKKTQTNKKTKKKREIEKKVQKESFFHIFKNRSAEDAEEEEDEDDDDEDGGLAGFYDVESIGESFYYLKYFGTKFQAPAYFGVEIEELKYGDGMDGLGDEDDDEDDEDDEGDEKPAKAPKGGKGKAPNPEECKKQ